MSLDLLLLPFGALAVALLGVLAAGALGAGRGARTLAVLGALAAAVLAYRAPAPASVLLRADGPARLWSALCCLGGAFLLLRQRGEGEVRPALVLGSLLGMTVLCWADNLLLLFLGLETMSLPLYLLLARGGGKRGLEAALKYFFAGGLAAGLFLLGMATYYEAFGTFRMLLSGGEAAAPAGRIALVLMGCAALFKVGAVPLHWWLPDAYEAAEPELAAFMSTSVKAAGVLLLLRIVGLNPAGSLPALLPVVAAATMAAGSLLALRQERLNRLLAYSSVAHAGYLMAAVWAWSRGSGRPATVLLYLCVYLLMSTAAFVLPGSAGIRAVADLRGFSRRSPGLAAAWSAAVLSLAGVPPTGGFLIKFHVLADLLRSGAAATAAMLALSSLIGLGAYFRLVREAWLEEPHGRPSPAPRVPAGVWLPVGCSLAALAAGVWPGLPAVLERSLAILHII